MLRAPFSSEYDPSEESEGSIDPLGLQPGYERLADRLLPAVTVRMGRPRFVTAMAVGSCVCERWDTDTVAADEVTQPWLVFEWFVIEAFIRAEEVLSSLSGIPGSQKVGNAIRHQRPVSAPAYLKTPTVFGFSGIFRRLARAIGIVTEDGRLDDGGYELLFAWAKDQGLEGFVDASSGAGHDLRERLRRAVSQGLEKGHTTYQPKDFWRELAERLDPQRPGRNESRLLLERILTRSGPMDKVTPLKEALIAQGGVEAREAEAPFLRKLTRRAAPDLKDLLTAIDCYELFGRAMTYALDGLRYFSSQNGGAPIGGNEFAATKEAKMAVREMGPAVARVREHPTLLEWEREQPTLLQAVERFEAVRSESDLFDAVLDFHEQVQRGKPPNGKRSWFERTRQGKVVVRSGYTVKDPPAALGTYVHEYRIPTFSRFLADLGAYR